MKSVLLLVLVSYSVIAQDHVDTIVNEFKNSDSKNVLVSAHRGDWQHAPENSINAIENCIAMGVNIVEIDVRKTKDGELLPDGTFPPKQKAYLDEIGNRLDINGEAIYASHAWKIYSDNLGSSKLDKNSNLSETDLEA